MTHVTEPCWNGRQQIVLQVEITHLAEGIEKGHVLGTEPATAHGQAGDVTEFDIQPGQRLQMPAQVRNVVEHQGLRPQYSRNLHPFRSGSLQALPERRVKLVPRNPFRNARRREPKGGRR
ncbi:hypothetical protein D3C75_1112970 [compost metagenome]